MGRYRRSSLRKAEIVFWIDQGWLEATKEGQGRTVAYLISPEALQRCLREHLQDLRRPIGVCCEWGRFSGPHSYG